MREISLHILDLVENSIKANATLIEIEVIENKKNDSFEFIINDNGNGMEEDFVKEVTNPFTTTRTTRKVGLGIPLAKLACEQAAGNFEIISTLGIGTRIKATFSYNNINRQPLGNISSTILMLVTANYQIDFIYKHKVNDNNFVFDTRAIKEILAGVELNNSDVYMFLSEFLNENINNLYN